MKTIAAISTAAAPGGIGVIRISGDEARAVGDRVFKSVSGAKLCDMAGYTCRFGHVYAPDGERLDECVATVLPHRTALRVKTWWSFPATADCSF